MKNDQNEAVQEQEMVSDEDFFKDFWIAKQLVSRGVINNPGEFIDFLLYSGVNTDG